jgi:hypothetical protein
LRLGMELFIGGWGSHSKRPVRVGWGSRIVPKSALKHDLEILVQKLVQNAPNTPL